MTEEKFKREAIQGMPSVRILDTLLEYAILKNASDLHFEPTYEKMTVRYRIDGILREILTLPKELEAGLLERIKILAGLKINECRLPQDGRFKISSPDYKVVFRVSVVPVAQGEKAFMRLLNEADKNLTLEELGMPQELTMLLKEKTTGGRGLILFTALAGNGKTSTLYSLLNDLNRPEINISTVEERIVYRLPGLNQCQINPESGLTLSLAISSFLNQDPDIIMIDEIRDRSSANLAVQAVLNSKLVLASLNAESVYSALKRLISLGLSPAAIAESASLIVAQKLVRKICPHCSAAVEPDKKTLSEIKKLFDLETAEGLKFYQSKGCEQCSNSGYLGRIGVFEFLEMTPAIVKLILSGAEVEKIKSAALKEGMLALNQDALNKALNGLISVEEILKVV